MRLKKKAERCRMKDKKAQRVDNIHINDRPTVSVAVPPRDGR